MNLYLISYYQSGYSVYDAAIVAAKTEDDAKLIHPNGDTQGWDDSTWAKSSEQVSITLVGRAVKGTKAGTVVLASFRAG